MTHRSRFADLQAEQAKITADWKAQGRLSEPWALADPEIVEIFSAGVAFGLVAGRRGRPDPAFSQNEWRQALRQAIEKAAAVEVKLEKAKEGMLRKEKK